MTRRIRRKIKDEPQRILTQSSSSFIHGRVIIISICLIVIAIGSTAISLFISNKIHNKPLLSELESQLEILRTLHIVPEYKRSLKKVLISLGTVNTTLTLQDDILLHLPEYSQIILILPKCNYEAIENELKDKPYCDRVQLIPFEEQTHNNGRFFFAFPDKDKFIQVDSGKHLEPRQSGSAWAQDLFEVFRGPDGQTMLLVPEIHKYYCNIGKKADTRVISDTAYLSHIRIDGIEVMRTPLVFQGGNILIDEINNQRVVFCGGDILNATRKVWQTISEKKLSDSEIRSMITVIFNADEIVVAAIDTGDRLQPSLLYHLDQAMIPLGDGVVGLTHIVNQPSVKPADDNEIRLVMQFLAKLKTALLDLGYKVIDIDMTVDNLLNYQHYANSIPYINAKTGQKTLLMPVFSGLTDYQKGLEIKNIASFKSVGYEVVTVLTNANKINGSIHCLINVLE